MKNWQWFVIFVLEVIIKLFYGAIFQRRHTLYGTDQGKAQVARPIYPAPFQNQWFHMSKFKYLHLTMRS